MTTCGDFRKQPVPPVSDNEVVSSDGGGDKARPVSLLTSMLSDHGGISPKKSAPTSGYTSGPSSSPPSTALSSPRARSRDEPVSILRRGSMGSDGEPFSLPMALMGSAPAHPPPSDKIDLVAKAPPPAPLTQRALKFAVANRPPSAQDRHVPEPEDEDAADNTDQGYEEDSEDGFTSDDEPSFMAQAHKMAMAGNKAKITAMMRSPSVSPPSRVTPPPPPRRGRGHVRVDPAAVVDHDRCTRHISPPPTSDARSSRRSSRSAPPGPRDGRAGSPVPPPLDDDEVEADEAEESAIVGEEEDEVDEDGEAGAEETLDADGDETSPPTGVSLAGVRNMLRRASEHIVSFRRPSFTMQPDSAVVLDSDTTASDNSRVILGRARSLGARPPKGILIDDSLAASRPMACPRQ